MQDLGLDHQRETVGHFLVAIQDINVDCVFGNMLVSILVKFLGCDNGTVVVEYSFS